MRVENVGGAGSFEQVVDPVFGQDVGMNGDEVCLGKLKERVLEREGCHSS